QPSEVPRQIRPQFSAGLGYIGRVREVRRMEREEHVRPQVHGHRALDFPHRRGRRRARRMAKGERSRPRRRSEERAAKLVRSLRAAAEAILRAADPAEKVVRTYETAAAWRQGALEIGEASPPNRPARPARPELKRPGDMPKRSTGPKGRIPLVHALAHIELNAVDLAWDVIARFGDSDLPR